MEGKKEENRMWTEIDLGKILDYNPKPPVLPWRSAARAALGEAVPLRLSIPRLELGSREDIHALWAGIKSKTSGTKEAVNYRLFNKECNCWNIANGQTRARPQEQYLCCPNKNMGNRINTGWLGFSCNLLTVLWKIHFQFMEWRGRQRAMPRKAEVPSGLSSAASPETRDRGCSPQLCVCYFLSDSIGSQWEIESPHNRTPSTSLLVERQHYFHVPKGHVDEWDTKRCFSDENKKGWWNWCKVLPKYSSTVKAVFLPPPWESNYTTQCQKESICFISENKKKKCRSNIIMIKKILNLYILSSNLCLSLIS